VNAVEKLQNNNQKKIVAAHVSKQFSGPIPPPEYLEHYNRIVPNAAERILAMAEREQTHRHDGQKRALDADIKEGKLGQILAFLIGVFTIGCGTYAAINGAQVAGSLIGSGGVIALVTAFILGRKSTQDNNKDDKGGRQ